MLLIIATISVLGVLLLFIWDTSRDQENNSNIFSYYTPFFAESVVTHHYLSSPESVWKTLSDLDSYQSWFPKIKRLLPDGDTDRYVHQFSFDRFSLLPGARLLLRPNSWSPFYKSRVVVVNKNEKITFDLKLNPFYREYVDFSLKPEPHGTSVVCRRSSRGLFSIFLLWGFSSYKYKILENLGYFIPSDLKKDNDSDLSSSESSLPVLSREAVIAQSVQAGLEGNMDLINAIPDKPTRGMAKATLVQVKRRGGELPDHLKTALSEKPASTKSSATKTTSDTGGGFASTEEQIHYLVNVALDGNDEPLNAVDNKVIRGKAKAMIVKIKRGSIDRPPAPTVSSPTSTTHTPKETIETKTPNPEGEQELIDRLVLDGVDGKMDEINALDNKVLRGKIKAAVVKQKRQLK